MRMLLLNLVLAMIWAIGTSQLTLMTLTIGFVLGFLVLYFLQPLIATGSYVRKVGRAVRLALVSLGMISKANVRVAFDVVTPHPRLRPGIIAIPLNARRDDEIAILANVVTLTPGTLALEIAGDRSCLFVHTLHLDDREAFERSIKQGLERQILELME